MQTINGYFIALYLLPFLFGFNAFAQEEMADRVKSYLKSEKISVPEGGQIAISVVEGETHYSFGLQKVEGELKLIDNSTTRFEIGSLTKVMTASLLADLAATQSIPLESKVAEYLPEEWRKNQALGYLNEISLTHLAAHHAGLPRDPLNAKTFLKKSTNPWSLYTLEELKFDLENTKVKNAVGNKYGYSNVGYSLLGLVIESTQNESYESALNTRIIQPLEMKYTFLSTEKTNDKPVLQGFGVKGNLVDNWTFNLAAPAGGVVSCTSDMTKFLLWNMDTKNAVAANCQKPLAKGQINGTLFSYVGLGWNITETELFKRYGYADKLIWHNGATAGFQSYLGFLKEKKVGVVVLTNFRSKKRHAIGLGEFILGQLSQ